jgi:glucose-6-phosphate isomerase
MISKLNSYKKLKNYAEKAIDLTKKDVFNIERIRNMQMKCLGYTFFYASERVDEKEIETLFELARETNAISKMNAMQNGEIINTYSNCPGENRAVLHTATRDFFDNKNASLEAKNASSLAFRELIKLEKFLNKIDKENKFQNLVQIGIGGSFLGPRALYDALKRYSKKTKKIYFISNVDPDDSATILNNIDLTKTLFVSVSKSGTTPESITNEEIVREKLKKMGLNPKDHIVSVTGEKSPMDNPSKYLESFYIWDFVGGRFSSTSMVGGVTLGFALGIDNFKEILKGANAMDKIALKNDKSNLPLFSALLGVWNRTFLNHSNLAVIPYSQALSYFTLHLQQLDMESNGKQINKNCDFVTYKTGPIVFGDIGTNAQHSLFQFFHQGTDIIPVEFIGYKYSQYDQDLEVKKTTSQQKLLSNLFAQSIAFAIGKKSETPNKNFSGNRPNHILLGQKLDPYSLGILLSYFENKIVFEGFVWDINSFDQEGVQLGKELANQFLNLCANKDTNFEIGKEFLKYLK